MGLAAHGPVLYTQQTVPAYYCLSINKSYNPEIPNDILSYSPPCVGDCYALSKLLAPGLFSRHVVPRAGSRRDTSRHARLLEQYSRVPAAYVAHHSCHIN